MDAARLHADQFTCVGVEIVLDLQFRIAGTAPVIETLIADVALDALHSGNHSPSPVVVRRSAAIGQPTHNHHCQGVIRLFMEKMDAEPLFSVRFIMPLLEPALFKGHAPSQWSNAADDLIFVIGFLIDNGGWRMAFILPGLFSVAMGFAYMTLRWQSIHVEPKEIKATENEGEAKMSKIYRALLIRVSAIIFLTTAISSIIFQSTTFALPKIFDERLQGLATELSDWTDRMVGAGQGDVATVIGSLAFVVFAVASIAQLIVGGMLDRFGPRIVFMVVATIQLVFFSIMPGLTDGVALIVALGFMIGAFGQIPINDYMIGKTASGAYRARIYGVRYVVSFTVLAATLPLIAYVYQNWGFDTLFRILAAISIVILAAVAILPKRLPTPEAIRVAAE